ncbi:hypothetical protein [Streptomyces sp. NBC_01171]|uniref:hypothetical protein n=1 Tax=Streptomyces sp. NBC_01171 TaxID=2903757 RepID=UPI00386CF729|nr:hypothetical protein OG448_00010 [Streptomyces sp. NBC_01171]WST06132.1 hypothetical protein OG448_30555 [Streptomyces sp. NBC_01171]
MTNAPPCKAVDVNKAAHTLVSFLDEQRNRFGGVEPICRGLTEHAGKITPCTYDAHHERRAAPLARAVQDAGLNERIGEVFEAERRARREGAGPEREHGHPCSARHQECGMVRRGARAPAARVRGGRVRSGAVGQEETDSGLVRGAWTELPGARRRRRTPRGRSGHDRRPGHRGQPQLDSLLLRHLR